MFCEKCGAKLIDGAIFCSDCGTKVPVIVKEPVKPIIIQEPDEKDVPNEPQVFEEKDMPIEPKEAEEKDTSIEPKGSDEKYTPNELPESEEDTLSEPMDSDMEDTADVEKTVEMPVAVTPENEPQPVSDENSVPEEIKEEPVQQAVPYQPQPVYQPQPPYQPQPVYQPQPTYSPVNEAPVMRKVVKKERMVPLKIIGTILLSLCFMLGCILLMVNLMVERAVSVDAVEDTLYSVKIAEIEFDNKELGTIMWNELRNNGVKWNCSKEDFYRALNKKPAKKVLAGAVSNLLTYMVYDEGEPIDVDDIIEDIEENRGDIQDVLGCSMGYMNAKLIKKQLDKNGLIDNLSISEREEYSDWLGIVQYMLSEEGRVAIIVALAVIGFLLLLINVKGFHRGFMAMGISSIIVGLVGAVTFFLPQIMANLITTDFGKFAIKKIAIHFTNILTVIGLEFIAAGVIAIIVYIPFRILYKRRMRNAVR